MFNKFTIDFVSIRLALGQRERSIKAFMVVAATLACTGCYSQESRRKLTTLEERADHMVDYLTEVNRNTTLRIGGSPRVYYVVTYGVPSEPRFRIFDPSVFRGVAPEGSESAFAYVIVADRNAPRSTNIATVAEVDLQSAPSRSNLYIVAWSEERRVWGCIKEMWAYK